MTTNSISSYSGPRRLLTFPSRLPAACGAMPAAAAGERRPRRGTPCCGERTAPSWTCQVSGAHTAQKCCGIQEGARDPHHTSTIIRRAGAVHHQPLHPAPAVGATLGRVSGDVPCAAPRQPRRQ